MTGTASFGGHVAIDILNPGLAVPGAHVVDFLEANGGVTDNGASLVYAPSAVATYDLEFPDADHAALQYTIEYAPAGLNPNETRLGKMIDQIQTARTSPNFVPIAARIYAIPTVPALGAAYDSLSGEGVVAVQDAAFSTMSQFGSIMTQAASSAGGSPVEMAMQHMTSSPIAMAGLDADYANPLAQSSASAHRGRAWVTAYGASQTLQGSASLGEAKTTDQDYGIAVGGDYRIAPHVVLGAAVTGASRRTASARSPPRARPRPSRPASTAAAGPATGTACSTWPTAGTTTRPTARSTRSA